MYLKHSHKMIWEGCFEDWKANMEQQGLASIGDYFEGVTCRYNNFVNAVC
jgi:GH35 family endo-1,4-beta-xylanase